MRQQISEATQETQTLQRQKAALDIRQSSFTELNNDISELQAKLRAYEGVPTLQQQVNHVTSQLFTKDQELQRLQDLSDARLDDCNKQIRKLTKDLSEARSATQGHRNVLNPYSKQKELEGQFVSGSKQRDITEDHLQLNEPGRERFSDRFEADTRQPPDEDDLTPDLASTMAESNGINSFSHHARPRHLDNAPSEVPTHLRRLSFGNQSAGVDPAGIRFPSDEASGGNVNETSNTLGLGHPPVIDLESTDNLSEMMDDETLDSYESDNVTEARTDDTRSKRTHDEAFAEDDPPTNEESYVFTEADLKDPNYRRPGFPDSLFTCIRNQIDAWDKAKFFSKRPPKPDAWKPIACAQSSVKKAAASWEDSRPLYACRTCQVSKNICAIREGKDTRILGLPPMEVPDGVGKEDIAYWKRP